MGVRSMRDADVEDQAPNSAELTTYDEEHLITYLRLLDADADEADWKEVARIVLRRDPDAEEARTYLCWTSHLARAKWMTKVGYRHLLVQAAREKQLH